ncbi:CASP-like protein 2C1 [Linum grandiflorum]
MKKNEATVVVVECGLRVGAVITLAVAASLVGFDSETEFVLFIDKRVTYKDLNSLTALVYVDIVAAAYNFTLLVLAMLLMWSRRRSSVSKLTTGVATSSSSSSEVKLHSPMIISFSWLGFIFDQLIKHLLCRWECI